MRVCRLCGSDGPFSPQRRVCKVCERLRINAWGKANRDKCLKKLNAWKEKNPLKLLAYHLKNRYGFGEDITNFILAWKGGPCAVCGKMLTKFGTGHDEACIEHDHETGNFRGIACGRCNRLLGLVKDDPTILNLASGYLRENDHHTLGI